MKNLELDRENRLISYPVTEEDKQRMLATYEQRAIERKRREEADLAAAIKVGAALRARGLLP